MAYTTPEKKVQNKIINYIKELKSNGHPIEYERRQSGGYSYKKGIPDLYVIYRGLHIEVEVKTENGQLSLNQIKYKEKCERIKCPYIVAYSFEEFKEKFTNIILTMY